MLDAGPVFAKLTTLQEVAFYEEAKRRQEASTFMELGSNLYDWMPLFMGTLTKCEISIPKGTVRKLNVTVVSDESFEPISDERYIVLQNLLYGYKNPCIVDIKLGAVLVDDSVAEEKRLRLAKVSTETTSGSLHFRVCGMKLFNGNSDSLPPEIFSGQNEFVSVENSECGFYLKFNKFFGRSLDETNAKEALKLFFVNSLPPKLRKALITKFYHRLQLLYNCILDTEVRIKSGSLFFCYESDPTRWENLLEDDYNELDPYLDYGLMDHDESDDEQQAEEMIRPFSKLKFIDFAHSKFMDGEGIDENIVVGVENLLGIFGELAKE